MKINTEQSNIPKIKPKKNLIQIILILFLLIVIFAGIVFGLFKLLATEQYYVINRDVPAKTQITQDMLTKITTSEGTAPRNAISINQVKQGVVYSKYPLRANDVLSPSNTGIDLDINVGIPDDWGTISFGISADRAVLGHIERGDYFSIAVTDKKEGTRYLFNNVLALEVNRATSQNKEKDNGKSAKISPNEVLHYLVGMPLEDIPSFTNAIDTDQKLRLILSPKSLKYKDIDPRAIEGAYFYTDIETPIDLLEGTDNTFTPILRDNNGRPVNSMNCREGKIIPESLCEQIQETESHNINREKGEFSEEDERKHKERMNRKIEEDKEENSSNAEPTNSNSDWVVLPTEENKAEQTQPTEQTNEAPANQQ